MINRCVWKVAPENRNCRCCVYNYSCKNVLPEWRDAWPDAERYIKAMEQIVGEPITTKSRRNDLVWARYLVAFQLSKDGYRIQEIANAVGRDRTTILHGLELIGHMEAHPGLYSKELSVWNKFQEMLNSQKSVDYGNQEMVVLHG